MPLVRLPLRGGEALAESRPIEGAEVYFCAKDRCPHYQGQLGLLPDTATMLCALVNYAPDRTCQPYYLEAAEHLDHTRRQTWQQRLDEAEAFEKSLGSSSLPPLPSSPSPGRGECVWERGPGGEGPGEAGLSSLGDDPLPSPGFQPGEEEAASSTITTAFPSFSPLPSPPSPGRGECVWERGPGGEGPGEAGSSAVSSPAAPASSAVANVLPFRPPSPAPRGRAGEGAPTQRRTTP